MKSLRVVLAVALLAGGLWWIVAWLNQRQPAPEKPTAMPPELDVESTAMSDAASRSVSETGPPPFIDRLRSHSHTIYLIAGRFTVEDADGQALVVGVTEGRFATLFPQLFREYRQIEGLLIDDNKSGPVMLPNGWRHERLVLRTAPKYDP
jgi:hypothetical protein